MAQEHVVTAVVDAPDTGSDGLSTSGSLLDVRDEPTCDVLRHIGRAIDALTPSTDPIAVFTSVAEAILGCGVVSASVEMIDHETATRVVRERDGEWSGPEPTEALLPQTQRLFAGGGEPFADGRVIAVAIRSTDLLSHVEPAPGPDFIGSLVCHYATPEPGPAAAELARLLVRHGVTLVHQQRHEQLLRKRTVNLEVALDSNRQIGTAIGIVMASHGISVDLAFERLRERSQAANRKLRDVAADVVSSGWTTA